jgi:hypothetical protein
MNRRKVERRGFNDFFVEAGCFRPVNYNNVHVRDFGDAAKNTTTGTGAGLIHWPFGTTRTW